MERKIIAIIPASGIGSRMNATCPKQHLLLQGKTILEHTLSVFLVHPQIEQIIVVVSKEDTYYHKQSWVSHPKVNIVFGGETRATSVLNALNTICDDNIWVAVHDAARPCLKRSDLDKILQTPSQYGAILATPAIDTIKRVKGNHIERTEDRSTLWHALTPQFFPAGLLKRAFNYAFEQNATITDESSAIEMLGFQPEIIIGSSDNLKITRPEDLALAEFYLTYLHSQTEQSL